MSEMTGTPALNKALAEMQADLPAIGKDKTGKIKGKDGKEGYSYRYADLATVSAEVLPRLGKAGLAFTSRPTIVEGQFGLLYELLHASGEAREGFYPLPQSGTPQSIGSAITYARRYCLLAVTGVAPAEDDDDGQAASDQTVHMSRPSAGDEWEKATPARPAERPAAPRGRKNQQQGGNRPPSAGDAWEQATPAAPAASPQQDGNGHAAQAPQRTQPAQVAADDELLGAWASKLDEITTPAEAEPVFAELERDYRGGVIDSKRHKVIHGAVTDKVRSLGGKPPSRPTAEDRGAQAVPVGKGDDGEWVQDFLRRVANASEDGLGDLQTQIGNAVKARTITPGKSADLSKAIKERRNELQGVPA